MKTHFVTHKFFTGRKKPKFGCSRSRLLSNTIDRSRLQWRPRLPRSGDGHSLAHLRRHGRLQCCRSPCSKSEPVCSQLHHLTTHERERIGRQKTKQNKTKPKTNGSNGHKAGPYLAAWGNNTDLPWRERSNSGIPPPPRRRRSLC